jgi:ribonucleoside-diphosphate reductase alpha chain
MTSLKFFTHATPTLFNAGTAKPQLSSCFLQSTTDSIEGIYQTLTDTAFISKYAGGIGLSVSNIRAQGAYIRGTNGTSNGLVPMLRVYNASSRFIDQGGGKRKGSVAIYIEPWHADIFAVMELRQNQGAEELRARDLFLALWTNDEFMRRVEADQDWSLMSPDVCPGLIDVHGADFDALYKKYESEGKARRVVKARHLWNHIGKQCIETGAPYIQFKDAANAKSNHSHLGTIRSSNLCTEIFEYSTPDEPAVCNLASISLPSCVTDGKFDFDRLANITKVITRNLNRVIDRNMYPVDGARRSNMKHRPIGIGTQGQSDVAFMLKMAYTDPEYIVFNKAVYETIYYAALDASCELAEKDGYYPSYPGSPTSRGIFQFDLWNKSDAIVGSRFNWPALKARIAKSGLRNSLLVAPMPTASTSQILGNYESFEVPTSNFFTRRTLAGEFIVVNKHLLRDLIGLGLWSTDMRDRLIAEHGSVQNLPIPDRLKQIYRTCNEVRIVDQIDRMLDRAVFIDQGQSFNINMRNGTQKKWSDAMFYAWKRGSKHGHYYFRSESAADPASVTVNRRPAAADDLNRLVQATSAAAAAAAAKPTTTTTTTAAAAAAKPPQTPPPQAVVSFGHPTADGKETLLFVSTTTATTPTTATSTADKKKLPPLQRSASWTPSDDDDESAAASPRNDDDSPTFDASTAASTAAAAASKPVAKPVDKSEEDDGPCLSCSS